jgi:hypothetical protein
MPGMVIRFHAHFDEMPRIKQSLNSTKSQLLWLVALQPEASIIIEIKGR